MDKETAKKVALGTAIGLGVGIAVTAVYYSNAHFLLKNSMWTPQGDMILTFYHRYNGILIAKPE